MTFGEIRTPLEEFQRYGRPEYGISKELQPLVRQSPLVPLLELVEVGRMDKRLLQQLSVFKAKL